MAAKSLTKLSVARKALSEAKTLQQVLDVCDVAAAVRSYVKAAGESLEIQNAASDIRLTAERKAGELLATMEKHDGDPRSHDVTRLEDIGITKMQSSRWQLAAKLPQDKYVAIVEQCNRSGKELTQSTVLRAARIHVFGEPECVASNSTPHKANLLELISMARAAIAELAEAFGDEHKQTLIAVLRDELETLEGANSANS
jgi:hypothetical protein